MTSIATGLDARATDAVAQAIVTLAGRRIAVLTGAGVSTDSGIPDYRGAGAPVRTPMTAEQFLTSDASRRRYWVGSHLGWKAFAAAAPNPGHRAIADLEARGLATGVVTQNVDGLHVRAGSRRVVGVTATGAARAVARGRLLSARDGGTAPLRLTGRLADGSSLPGWTSPSIEGGD